MALLALYLLLQRRRSPLSGGALVGIGAAWALIPSLWTLHDLHAYGQSHFWQLGQQCGQNGWVWA